MNAEAIAEDIFEELPRFARIENIAATKDYVLQNHLPLLGIGLSVFLWVI